MMVGEGSREESWQCQSGNVGIASSGFEEEAEGVSCTFHLSSSSSHLFSFFIITYTHILHTTSSAFLCVWSMHVYVGTTSTYTA